MEASPLAAASTAPPDSAACMLDHLATQAAHLYSLPSVAAEVLQLTGSGEVDRSALKACLENDPALTTRILKVVNSSLFGLSRKVTDLGQALALLGVKPLKMLVLGFSLPHELEADLENEVLTGYWRHTLLKAAGCREISRRLFPARGEEAFTAGLLQDVGELVLIQQLGPSYVRFRSQVRREQRPLREAEWLALGFDHVDLSARLLTQWGMPPSFVAIVASSSSPEDSSPDRHLVSALKVSEQMANVIERNGEGLSSLNTIAQSELGLSAEQVQEILDVLTQRAEELARILSRELPSRAELSETAHARLAETTAQMLEGANEQTLLADMTELQTELQAAARRQMTQSTGRQVMHPAERPRLGQRTWEAPTILEHSSLANDEPLLSEVSAAIARCRGLQRSLSLVLLQAHGAMGREGGEGEYPAPQGLLKKLNAWSQDRGTTLALPRNTFGFLWESCNRREAYELARHVLRQAHDIASAADRGLAEGWTLCAGLATLTLPPRNFPPQELIAAAQGCLAGALRSCGTVKSIEF